MYLLNYYSRNIFAIRLRLSIVFRRLIISRAAMSTKLDAVPTGSSLIIELLPGYFSFQ